MIRINLLPPEFRRRRGPTISPNLLIAVGGGVLCVLLLAFYGYVHFKRLPYAKAELKRVKNQVSTLEKQVQAVETARKEIAAIKAKMAVLDSLVGEKVEWAETLWDFADLVGRADTWGEPGFQVACLNLRVAPGGIAGRTAAKGGGTSMSFDWTWQIVGDKKDDNDPIGNSGKYLQAFWDGLAASRFWTTWGFQDKPDKTYVGDSPKWNEEIQKVVISGNSKFVRLHQVKKPDAGKPAAAGGK